MCSKSASQIFKILFQTGDINIFVLRGVFLRVRLHDRRNQLTLISNRRENKFYSHECVILAAFQNDPIF